MGPLAVDDHLFRLVVEQASMAVVVVDSAGQILYVNQALCQLLGYSGTELLGQPVERMVPSRMDEAHRAHREGFLGHPERRPMGQGRDLLAVTRDGREIPVEVGLHPVHTPGGVLVAAVVVDISDRLRHQQQNERHDRLEALGFLAAGLAHDYNNVLAGIQGNTDLLEQQVGVEARTKARLDAIRRLVTKGSQIARRLISFAKGGAPVSVPVNLVPLVREAAETAALGTGTKVQCLPRQESMTAKVDPGQFGQVITNLVINAVQALGGKGTVVLTGEVLDLGSSDVRFGVPPGRYYRWTVHDDGPGIPAEVLGKVFDPFFTTKAQGSGLGLAIVHSILNRNGGGVAVLSEEGQGTTFELVLPAIESLPESEPPTPSPVDFTCATPCRVVVMDDNGDLRETLVSTLEHCGYEVTAASSGEEALALIDEASTGGRPFELALLDVLVPGRLGGVDVVRVLNRRGLDLALVLMSGYQDGDLTEALETGNVGYLPKPFTLDGLLREIGRVQARRAGRSTD